MNVYDELEKDVGGFASLALLKFRSGAVFTAPFGLDGAFGKLRIHSGVDRGHGSIFMPFKGTATFVPDSPQRFGNLLTIRTPYGFDVRIGHMKELDADFARMVSSGALIPARTYIGECGREGSVVGVDGRHSHTEIVSHDLSCDALDQVLRTKFRQAWNIPYTEEDVRAFCKGRGFPATCSQTFRSEMTSRNVAFINRFYIDRIDYLTRTPRRFYSSRALFNM